MPTVSNSTTFDVTSAADVIVEEVTIPIISAPLAAPDGTGKLVHPTLGTYIYEYAPTSWTNIDTDIIVKPEWMTEKVLTGQKFTLWRGYDRDVVVKEKWAAKKGDAAMLNGQIRQLLDFYQNPPTPPSYVAWYPDYTTNLGFYVIMLSLTAGGDGITFDYFTRTGMFIGEVELTMQIAARI
jgi:hypothetical protein